MKYALLIYENEAQFGDRSTAAFQAHIGRHMAFSQSLGQKRIGGSGLNGVATATTIRTANGAKTIHDGPFAETKEQLGGFYLVEAADLDEAIAIARQVPVMGDGSVEIRPMIGP